MDLIALVVSALSLLVAGVGTVLANRRANEALTQSRKASADALWSALQDAVQRLIGFDPAAEPVGERLANLRIAMIALVDELPDWTGLDTWLDAEHALGAVLGRQVMARSSPGERGEQRLQVLDPYFRWAEALGNNLRWFRSQGPDAEAAGELRTHAAEQTKLVYEDNGWAPPHTTPPGLGTDGT